MKCALIVLCVLTYVNMCVAKWCVKNETNIIEVVQTHTRSKSSHWMAVLRTEYYTVKAPLVTVKERRVCCDGYILSEFGDTKECSPVCPNGCPSRSECVEPSICQCHEGYHMQDRVCRPDCGNCENGQCSDLGICTCKPMYVRMQDACKPICSRKCKNGFCSAPDKCDCNPGYQEMPETNKCEPTCKEGCGENAYCLMPEVCQCKYGFFGNATDACQPWCKVECKNGDCVGPNNCACYQGFVKIGGLCIPDCQSGCKYGQCIEEGVCQCWPGYVYNNSTRSCHEEAPTTEHTNQPGLFCSNDCGNGTCIAGVCYCQEGFINAHFKCSCNGCKTGDCIDARLCLEISEYKSSSEEPSSSTSDLPTSSTSELTTTLATDCNGGCWAGICVDGVCQCADGLILNNDNDCIMPCEVNCKNGVCTQDHVCECRAGYVHKNDSECVPQCERVCVHGFCIAPNHCECLEGYISHLDPLLAHICLPTCDGLDGDEGCLNGTCVAVNKCQCLKNFVPSPENRFECMPSPEKHQKQHGYFWTMYLLLGVLILLSMTIFGLFALKKFHRDSYNVDKVEKSRGTVLYRNDDEPCCTI